MSRVAFAVDGDRTPLVGGVPSMEKDARRGQGVSRTPSRR